MWTENEIKEKRKGGAESTITLERRKRASWHLDKGGG